MSNFFLLALAASLVSVAAGFLLNAFVFKFATAGPTIAIVAAVLFSLSLLGRVKN